MMYCKEEMVEKLAIQIGIWGKWVMIRCPCCECLTIDDEAYDEVITEICPVCFWHYDVTGHEHPHIAIGPNHVSLYTARENYKLFGAKEKRVLPFVRPPYAHELKPEYIWGKSKYGLFIGKWVIAMSLEAGYQMVSFVEDESQYIRLTDQIYFHSMLLPWPEDQTLLPEELECFYNGLKLASKYISAFIPEDSFLIIALRHIIYSPCHIQNEAFTAAAIQWASETFHFPMPNITVSFDETKSWNGMYVFDFSAV